VGSKTKFKGIEMPPKNQEHTHFHFFHHKCVDPIRRIFQKLQARHFAKTRAAGHPNKRANTIDRFASDNTLLATLFRQSRTSPVTFAALYVNRHEHNVKIIIDIGLSIWTLGGHRNIESFHWNIQDKNESTITTPPDSTVPFEYGFSEVAKLADIGQLLQTRISTLQAHSSTICIVGHRIDSILSTLKAYWEPQIEAQVLDTQRIWQFQNQKMGEVSFEYALATAPGLSYEKSLLSNAGNDARYTMRLLQSLSREAVKTKP
jgi:hypothetical protein